LIVPRIAIISCCLEVDGDISLRMVHRGWLIIIVIVIPGCIKNTIIVVVISSWIE